MALTLLDVARTKETVFEKGVISTIIRAADLLRILPLDTTGTTEIHTKKKNGIPTLGFRARGESHGSIDGTGTTVASDAVWSMGGQIDIDKVDYLDKNSGAETAQDRLDDASKGAGWTFNNYLINGDHATDADGFEGLKVRLANSASTQVLYGVSSTQELDIRALAAPTDDDMFSFLDAIDDAIAAGDGEKMDVAITDTDVIRAIKRCERRLKLYNNSTNAVDMPTDGNNMRRTSADIVVGPQYVYNGCKFYAAGKTAAQNVDIVATTTVNSVACRPIYFAKLGKPYLRGIQQYPISISPYALLENKLTYRAVIDWAVGLSHVHPRSFSVLRGVRV